MRKDRDFILLYLSDWLENGIKRTLSEAQRGCFTQLLCQAGRSPDPGTIHLLPSMPYEDEKLAQLLHVRVRTLQATLKLLLQMGLISRDGDGIHITNWEDDQPDWETRRRTAGGKKTPAKSGTDHVAATPKPPAATHQPPRDRDGNLLAITKKEIEDLRARAGAKTVPMALELKDQD